ncbi:unnamed protein product [Musa acuminata subsp. burmannicoides]
MLLVAKRLDYLSLSMIRFRVQGPPILLLIFMAICCAKGNMSSLQILLLGLSLQTCPPDMFTMGYYNLQIPLMVQQHHTLTFFFGCIFQNLELGNLSRILFFVQHFI